MAGEFIAHSPRWNPHYRRKQNATFLEDVIEQFWLLVNNEPGCATRPLSREILVIDHAFSSAQLGLLTFWEISEEHPSLSDHKLIVLRWEDVDDKLTNKSSGRVTGWDIQMLLNDQCSLKATHLKWIKSTENCYIINNFYTREDLDKEVR